MFQKFSISFALTVATAALFALPAQALTIAGDCSVFAHWSFPTPPTTPTAPPTSFSTTPCPAGSLDPAHDALIDFNPVTNGAIGTHWQITLPNFIDELDMKKIWIHIQTPTPADQFSFIVEAHDPTSPNPIPGVLHEVIQNGTTAPTDFIAHFWVTPNPDWETIDIITANPMPGITEIWVHTISMDVPEPGTLALFGLGLMGLGFSRRRQAAA